MEPLPVVRRRANVSSGTMWSHNTCARQKSADRVAVVVCILQGKRKCENCAQDAAHSGQKQKLCSFIKALLRDFEVIVGSLVVCMKTRALQSL